MKDRKEKSMNIIVAVDENWAIGNKGDLLAKLTQAELGVNGTNVCGENLKPREVKRLMLHYGRNISISEDKTCIYSEVNGHVVLVEEPPCPTLGIESVSV